MLSFNYEFELEADYGGIDPITHKYTGMVLKLIEEVLCTLCILITSKFINSSKLLKSFNFVIF